MLRRSAPRSIIHTSPIGHAHPDVHWGAMQGSYRGPGWVGYHKALPQEALLMQGGNAASAIADRVGQILDPEDPRHPIAQYYIGGLTNHDGAVHRMVEGAGNVDTPQSSRVLQVLYDSYLEPFSMHRVCGILREGGDQPNNHYNNFAASVHGCGETSSIVGNTLVGMGSNIGEGVTMKGDVNNILLHEGSQVLDNCCLVCDRPSNLHHYQRSEDFNPYQTWDSMDGVMCVKQHTIIESNCFLDSCVIGMFNRIGHGSKIMKGVYSENFVHVMPGSVVTANTKMKEGELWGGAPARKLGKISKYEMKKIHAASNHVQEFYGHLPHEGMSNNGDQFVHRTLKNQELQTLLIKFEDQISPSLKARITNFVEGREPWAHMIVRITQLWTQQGRSDEKSTLLHPPAPHINNYSEHNSDSFDSPWHGTRLNMTNYINEFNWA